MDADVNDPTPAPDANVGIGKFLTGRSEVKSAPFIVYSAKKFPGLMESTQLSRTIADQGCRVRIRRDVRMRRRDQLSSMKDENWEEYEDETAEQRAARNEQPDPELTPPASSEVPERQRSHSNASIPLQPQPSRRTSSQDLNQQYQNSYMPPPPPQQYAPQVYTPQSPYETTPVSPYPPAGSYMAQQPQFSHPQYPYQASGMTQVPQSPHYMPLQSPTYEQQYSQHVYPQHQGVPNSYGYPQQYIPGQPVGHMGSNMHSAYGPVPQPPHLQQSMYPGQSHQISSSALSLTNGTALPPLKAVDPLQPKPEIPSPSLLGLTDMARHPPPPPPQYNNFLHCAPIPQPAPQYLSGVNNGIAAKRSFGSVFDSQHMTTPMRGGARPAPESASVSAVAAEDGSDEDFDLEQLKMRYRRADGTEISRRWPLSK